MGLGKLLKQKNIVIPEAYWELLPLILDCFGDLQFDQKITKIMPGTEDKKKKDNPQPQLQPQNTQALKKEPSALPDPTKVTEENKQGEPKKDLPTSKTEGPVDAAIEKL